MAINVTQKIKLTKLIKQLKSYRGRHTELVSVYVPAGYDLTKIIQTLQDEKGTATNIKDQKTSKAVQTALERMIQTMRVIDKTPENGLAIFSGNISDKDNVDKYEVFWIDPPEELNLKLYRCDQKFITDPLEEMATNETTFGLIAIDKGEATVGLLVGSSIRVIRNLNSTVPGKFKTGGQSAQRFARIREGAAVEFYKRVADVAIQEFTYMKELKGILVGGPGTTKNNFVDGSYLNGQMKDLVLGIKDITYTNAYGLQELVEVSQDVLHETEVAVERKIIGEFLETLGKNPHMAVYGKDETKKALEMGAVEKLIVCESDIEDEELEELTQLQEESRAEFHYVTNKTPEGQQFSGIGGVGGILRYPISS